MPAWKLRFNKYASVSNSGLITTHSIRTHHLDNNSVEMKLIHFLYPFGQNIDFDLKQIALPGWFASWDWGHFHTRRCWCIEYIFLRRVSRTLNCISVGFSRHHSALIICRVAVTAAAAIRMQSKTLQQILHSSTVFDSAKEETYRKYKSYRMMAHTLAAFQFIITKILSFVQESGLTNRWHMIRRSGQNLLVPLSSKIIKKFTFKKDRMYSAITLFQKYSRVWHGDLKFVFQSTNRMMMKQIPWPCTGTYKSTPVIWVAKRIKTFFTVWDEWG